MKTLWSAVVSAVFGFMDDDCMVNGAALAFYTIFSLPPLLVMVFFVAGWFGFSQSQINSVVRRQIGLPTSELTQDSEQALPTADTGEKDTGFGDLSSLVERRRQQTDSVQALGPVSNRNGSQDRTEKSVGVAVGKLLHRLLDLMELLFTAGASDCCLPPALSCSDGSSPARHCPHSTAARPSSRTTSSGSRRHWSIRLTTVANANESKKERPEVIALWSFGLGFVLGWKLKIW